MTYDTLMAWCLILFALTFVSWLGWEVQRMLRTRRQYNAQKPFGKNRTSVRLAKRMFPL